MIRGKCKLVVAPYHKTSVVKVIEKLIDVLANSSFMNSTVIMTRDLSLISKVRELHSTALTAIFINNPYPSIHTIRRYGVRFIVMPYSIIRSRVVKESHVRGIEVIAWLVNDPTIYIKMRSLGVDAVTTEKPDIAREAESLGL